MADRRSFLGAFSGVAASVLLAGPADAQTATPAAAATGPLPKPSASPKPPGPVATAIAASMRRFDPALTDTDLDTIAHAIDDNRRGAARLNPQRATALRNGDEPVTHFSVRDER
jgi:hypothetical protein